MKKGYYIVYEKIDGEIEITTLMASNIKEVIERFENISTDVFIISVDSIINMASQKKVGEKVNRYTNLIEAIRRSKELTDDGRLLADGACNWEHDNLIEAILDEGYTPNNEDIYCVGHQGNIGRMEGDNVEWILRVTE